MADTGEATRCDVCSILTQMLFDMPVKRPNLAEGTPGRVLHLCVACRANPNAVFVTS